MRFLRTRRGQASAILVVCLALFLARPGANWLRSRIVRSISLTLGRQVEVGSVHLRLLPQPGFDLENFVVHDDPGFSAEPVLRAPQVMAAIRLTSVVRGRLEIARLSLTEPSLNLVRGADGHWNLENLLERAAKTPVAPTAKAKSPLRPAFPYIEADRGRINFKLGQEKKAYSLTEADFGLWQDSENTWAVRLRARPVRTDFNLTDTGLLRVEGSWQRAATLRETPLQFDLQWEQAQLGQATKLAYGKDKGWRGTFTISAKLTGTPGNLSVVTDASMRDFRRYDVPADIPLRLAAHCDGRYSSADHVVSGLACRAPIGHGVVTLDGNFAVLAGFPAYELALIAQNVPLQSLVALAEHAKKSLPDDLIATGNLDASIRLGRRADLTGGQPAWHGGGETSGLRLSSRLTRTELILDRVPFSVSTVGNGNNPAGTRQHRPTEVMPPGQLQVDVGPFSAALGGPSPAEVKGWVSRSGYDFSIRGNAAVQKLLAVAHTTGLPVSPLTADGQTRINLKVSGGWTGFAAPQITGESQLRSVRAEVRGLHAPLEIGSASLLLASDQIRVTDLTASAGGSTWHGSITLARPCATPGTCEVRFDLHADRIATDELGVLFNPHPSKRPWYRFLSPSQPQAASFFASLHAAGKVKADRVLIHKLTANRVSGIVQLQNGLLQLSDLGGEVLGGKHRGEWKGDFTGNAPVYSGSGVLERVALGQLAAAMHDDWVSGTATGTYRVIASGISAAELFSSANATLQIEADEVYLPHIVLAGGGSALRMNRFEGQLLLREGKFEIEQGKLETPAGIYQVSGTASLGRVLDLRLAREGAHSFNVTGTLAAPHVAQAPETRAALKP